MGVKYNLVAKTGEYTNDKGETKARWSRIGVVLETNSGNLAIKLENIPVGWDGFANMAEPDNTNGKPTQEKSKATGNKGIEEMQDDVPFN